MYKNSPTTKAKNSKEWRNWLSKNGKKESSVWLIIYKKASGVPTIKIGEAIDDAICFGWIDSAINKKDDISYYQYFARRNPKSNWSRVNKEKVRRLSAQGLIMPQGQALIDLAKKTGTWDALNDVENLIIPDDMKAYFKVVDNIALENWENFSRSAKRGTLEWIFNAKKSETRSRRIKATVDAALLNKKAIG